MTDTPQKARITARERAERLLGPRIDDDPTIHKLKLALIVKAIEDAEEAATEREQVRWQEAIDEIVVRHCPDRDGSGTDTGDPLDVTLCELNQMIEAFKADVGRRRRDRQDPR